MFNFRLKHEHLIDDLDASRFYAWGRARYAEQLGVLEHAAHLADPLRSWQQIERDLQSDHPPAENLIYEHLKVVRRTRDWIVKNDLLTVPFDEEGGALAVAAPAVYGKHQWYGFGGAPVGINSNAVGAWTLIPADARWPPERREEFLRGHSYAMINAMAPHEVYPGHGMIQLFLNHNPRKLRTFSSSYANQAWCYYIEWNLVPAYGFYPADKQKEYTVEMERNKLWRYARAIYDPGMHTGRMPYEEGVEIMHSGVLFAERFAQIEVEETTRGGSGTSIPTWGYYEFLQLRDDYFARMAAMGKRVHSRISTIA